MAWIDLTGLGKYHEKIKAWIEKNKYVHPANHPATMIVQDSLNQFVSKEQKDKWNNKLDADANAVSASKLYKAVRINGIEFDGTKDIEFDISSSYSEKSYFIEIKEGIKTISVPEQYWISNTFISVYVNGIKLVLNKHYTADSLSRTINLIEPYICKSDVEITFSGLDTSNSFVYELLANNNSITLETNKTINDKSIIYVFVDGIKQIQNKHYTIDYENKTIKLNETYLNKTDVEILILKF